MKKIEEIRKRKIEELKERKHNIIAFTVSIIYVIIAVYFLFLLAEKEERAIEEFCKNKTGIYKFPNCTETWSCFGVEITVDCARINALVEQRNK